MHSRCMGISVGQAPNNHRHEDRQCACRQCACLQSCHKILCLRPVLPRGPAAGHKLVRTLLLPPLDAAHMTTG